jgi:hypothetical protein
VLLLVLVGVPALGTLLTVEHPAEVSDVALVLEGTGKDAMDVAERWRTAGLVRDVLVVEAPLKTHALVTYWSDLVARGLAPPAPTPAPYLHVVRAPSTQSAEQARASLPVLLRLGARSVLAPGGGAIGTRLVERDLNSVLGQRGIRVLLTRSAGDARDPSRWYTSADDRRAVLDVWLQFLVPWLSAS